MTKVFLCMLVIMVISCLFGVARKGLACFPLWVLVIFGFFWSEGSPELTVWWLIFIPSASLVRRGLFG